MNHLLLLGPPEVLAGGGPVSLPPRLLALLAYVALAPPGHVVRRDVLLATFWPRSDAGSARNALNQALYELRNRLGRDSLVSRGKCELSTGDSVWTDVREFGHGIDRGRIVEALEVYRGDLLEGLHISNAPSFERWLDRARDRLRRRAAAAAAELAAAEEANGRLRSATGWLDRALELDAADESLGRRRIRLLFECGDRLAAARRYRELVDHLREFELAPSRETIRLGRRLFRRPAGAGTVPGNVDVVTLPAPERRIARDLVDRAGELAVGNRTGRAVALELLGQAVRIDSGFAPARTARARFLADDVLLHGGPRRLARRAQADADAALQLNPVSAEAHVARGCALEALTRYRDGIEAFRNALRIRPGHAEAGSRLGRALMYAGDLAWSLRVTRDEASRQAEDFDLMIQLGMVDFCLGRDDEGREITAHALRLRPGHPYVEAAWAFYEQSHGHFDQAASTLDILLEREPDSFLGRFFKGEQALLRRDYEKALGHFRHCHEASPTGRPGGLHLSAQAMLGLLLVKTGDPGLGGRMLHAAERDCREILETGAEFGGFLLELAIVAAGRGEAERAVKRLTRAYERGYLQFGLIDRHPAFDDLRGRPDYRSLIAAIEGNVREQEREAP